MTKGSASMRPIFKIFIASAILFLIMVFQSFLMIGMAISHSDSTPIEDALFWLTLYPVWYKIAYYQYIESPIWLILSLVIHCLLYTTILYTIISGIIVVVRRIKSANSHTSPGE